MWDEWDEWGTGGKGGKAAAKGEKGKGKGKGKGKDGGSKGKGKGKGGKSKGPASPEAKYKLFSTCSYFSKFCLEPHLSSLLIGQKGATMKKIQTDSNAVLKVSDRTELFPGTAWQIVMLGGNTEDELGAAIKAVYAQIKAGSEEPAHEIGICVPQEVAGRVIGKGGANAKELRQLGATQVSLAPEVVAYNDDGNGEQIVKLAGSVAALERVTIKLAEWVNERREDEWFNMWGSRCAGDYANRANAEWADPMAGSKGAGG